MQEKIELLTHQHRLSEKKVQLIYFPSIYRIYLDFLDGSQAWNMKNKQLSKCL